MEKTHLYCRMSSFALGGVMLTLGGCAAVDANLNHGDLQINTHLSETVFLDPVPTEKRSVYVTFRNTSDHPELDIKGPLTAAIAQRGYLIVQDASKAEFMLRANVLQAGEVDAKSKGALLSAQYGEPLLGGGLAAGVTASAGGNVATTAGVGLGVAAATFAANQVWQQKTYSVVIDLELAARPLTGAKVSQNTSSAANNMNGTSQYQYTGTPKGAGMQNGLNSFSNTNNSRSVTQSINEESDFKKYQIRAVSYADQVNLKFETALAPLETKLVSVLSNLFEEGQTPSPAQVDAAFNSAAPAITSQQTAASPKPKKVKKAAPTTTAAGGTDLDETTPPAPPR